MAELTEKIVKIIGAIPEGKVATYGQVAHLAGNPKGARQVSWTLRTQTKKYNLPWQRVISSQGKISTKGEDAYIQADILRAEGVYVDPAGRIDLNTYGWDAKADR